MKYRLGLDLGANSIGWCCLRLDSANEPVGILATGVRIFSDGRNPKDGSSLAAARRLPRSMRRNRDRYLRRRSALLNELTRHGLMPEDAESRRKIACLDPYALRAAALDRRLDPTELGRVLFHLNQRRGFKSNRKTDRTDDKESGKIRQAALDLQRQLGEEGHGTLGSWLAKRHAEREMVRARLSGIGTKSSYAFYPLREMVEHEFDSIRVAQAPFHPGVSAADWERVRHIIFFQRPLARPVVGKCWLEPQEDRAYRALPTAQAFRIAQQLASLRLATPGEPSRVLTAKERDLLWARLRRGTDASFDTIRKLLRLPGDTDFNLESLRSDTLKGDATAKLLGSKKVLGDIWHNLDLEQQDAVARVLLTSGTDEEAHLQMAALGIPREPAERALRPLLPEGTASLSHRAMARILPYMREGRRYDEAVQAAGYGHHSDQRTGEIRSCLPYYGEVLFQRLGTGSGVELDPTEKRWGRASNPTVHVALNQLRRVVNCLIEKHGAPTEIVVETLRELGRSQIQRREYEKQQKLNQQRSSDRDDRLRDLGLPPNARNRMRLRLWEEQAADPVKRCCPYTGKTITLRMAVSDEIEEDHILPFALVLDDSAANRVLVTREANRTKARRTPYDAFGATPYWPQIVANSELLPPQKRWRFAPDALSRYSEGGDFLARHLTDSAFIATYAKLYLEVLAPGKVWTTPGRLTAILRRVMGLDPDTVFGEGGREKTRQDHRHHAVDAVVVALTSRSHLQRFTEAAKRAADSGRRLLADFDEPWPGFISEVSRSIRSVVVSHKPDTGWQGALHNDTAYGLVERSPKGIATVVVRRALADLESWKPTDARDSVRDAQLAERIGAALDQGDTLAKRAALEKVVDAAGRRVRRVRTVERLKSFAEIVDRRTERPYKVVKRDGNHRAELWQLPNGSCRMTIVTVIEAAQEDVAGNDKGRVSNARRPHPAAKLVARLHKNDCVAIGEGHERELFRVVKMREQEVTMALCHEAGNLKARDASREDPFRYTSIRAKSFFAGGARKVWVDPAGTVHDAMGEP